MDCYYRRYRCKVKIEFKPNKPIGYSKKREYKFEFPFKTIFMKNLFFNKFKVNTIFGIIQFYKIHSFSKVICF